MCSIVLKKSTDVRLRETPDLQTGNATEGQRSRRTYPPAYRNATLPSLSMRICIIYDCLYPWTVGGGERWYRNLAAEFAASGHEVTYLTRLQWDPADPPEVPGVEVIAVSRREPLYGQDGNRRVGPPLRFGWGVLRHLLFARGRYDVVHTCAFPYFSLLAARAALLGSRTRIGVDWFEVWTRGYWRSYLGPVGGRIGFLVQRLSVRLTPQAFIFSRLHAQRLRDNGLTDQPIILAGLYTGPLAPETGPSERQPLVVFAGRHIAEKRAPAIPAAIAATRERIPGLRARVLGDGPQRPQVLAEIARLGLEDVVEAPGFVSADEVQQSLREATVLLLPSSREGYGMVVIEAASAGTPSVVVAGDDNAAVELIEPGVNGAVAQSSDAESIADALVDVHDGGAALRARTAAWFAEHAPRLTAHASARTVLDVYARR
jgi:glycosyltransferase involved in cell wall biosynthesis